MKVVLQTSWTTAELWKAEIAAQAPGIDLEIWPEIGDPATVDAVLCWLPPEGLFDGMTNLRLVQYLGAGVDGLYRSGIGLPDVPIARLVDPVMSQRMAEYALYGTMRAHRLFDRYERQRQEQDFTRHLHDDPAEVGVGVMGVGEIGLTTIRLLRRLGYDVAGWSRTAKHGFEVPLHAGDAGLAPFLARSKVMICLLPLTPETTGILDARTFALMPSGGHVINIARGGHLIVADLLAALDGGHLGGAMLDVFEEEPLAADSPLWSHPAVFVTPHTAGISNPRTATAVIVDQLRRLQQGEPLTNLVDRKQGY